jgi:hypothetical protein
MSMKIAVVFYGKFTGNNIRGELQGWEESFTYLKNNILGENVDIFFHGWDDDEVESKKLVDTFKPKKYILEKQLDFNHPHQSHNFVPQGPWETKKYIYNNYSRFYSIKKAVSLVEETYDLILLTRFDTIFYSPFPFNEMNPENFYVTNWVHNEYGYGFNDAWFISGYKNMVNFSLIFDRLDEYYNLESDYVNFLKSKGLTLENLPSGHVTTKYRTLEIGLENNTYTFGEMGITWDLIRYKDFRNSSLRVNKTFDEKICKL